MLPIQQPFQVKYVDEFEDEAVLLNITEQGSLMADDLIIKNIKSIQEEQSVEYVKVNVVGAVDDQKVFRLLEKIKKETLVNIFGYKRIEKDLEYV